MIPQINRILYATDLGDKQHTRPVFRRAVSLARRYGARLTVLHILEPLGGTGVSVVDNYLSEVGEKINSEEVLLEVSKKMKEHIRSFIDEEMEAEPPERTPEIDIHIASGIPSREIIRIAEDKNVDMIVIGRSAHTFFGGSVMGTCARRVTRHSSIPVLLVPNA